MTDILYKAGFCDDIINLIYEFEFHGIDDTELLLLYKGHMHNSQFTLYRAIDTNTSYQIINQSNYHLDYYCFFSELLHSSPDYYGRMRFILECSNYFSGMREIISDQQDDRLGIRRDERYDFKRLMKTCYDVKIFLNIL